MIRPSSRQVPQRLLANYVVIAFLNIVHTQQ
jgi:hypothetical protein